jgi:hypothetical protein
MTGVSTLFSSGSARPSLPLIAISKRAHAFSVMGPNIFDFFSFFGFGEGGSRFSWSSLTAPKNRCHAL